MPRLGGLLQTPHTAVSQGTRSVAACGKRSWSSGLPRNSDAPRGRQTAAVAAILTTIKEALRDGEPVCLRRFGTWQVRAKRARLGRNPKTGTVAAIEARRVVRFGVSRTLKQAVAAVGSPAD